MSVPTMIFFPFLPPATCLSLLLSIPSSLLGFDSRRSTPEAILSIPGNEMGLRAFDTEGLFCPYPTSTHIGETKLDSLWLLLHLIWPDGVMLSHHV